MGKETGISWCHHTFNPWRGCTKVSPGCDHCYAETSAKRNPKVLGIWGDDGTRPTAAEAYWRQPLTWNRKAEAAGERRRVFCASLADVGEDRPDLVAPRARLCELILATDWLDWQLLTKRIENVARLFPREVLERAIVGTTTENQEQADKRIPVLIDTPARQRFISAEPLLGPIDLDQCGATPCDGWPGVDWVIVGGESGNGARPFGIAWARSIVQQCQAAGVAVFVKQLGANPAGNVDRVEVFGAQITHYSSEPIDLIDKKGGDPSEWPEDLRVREFPEVRA